MITNLQLIEYAEKQIGRPYWWGTFGNIATENLHDYKVQQYPDTYNSALYSDWRNQLGMRCHDCVGLIKGAIWSGAEPDGLPIYTSGGCPDTSADGMHSASKVKGTIDSIPEVKGLYVWRKGHIGIYIGNGKVIEAHGHKNGVIKSNLKERNFTHWGYIPYGVKYVEDDEMDISKLTDKECYEIITKANRYASELEASTWAAPYVQEAKAKGISDGTRPRAIPTRQEVMGMLVKFLK